MDVRKVLQDKKQWRAHVRRVDALPQRYRIVYGEVQKYWFRVAPAQVAGSALLAELLEFFERGVADKEDVLDLTGPDVAAFADGLLDIAAPR